MVVAMHARGTACRSSPSLNAGVNKVLANGLPSASRATCLGVEPSMDGSAIEEKLEFIGWLRKATLFENEQRARYGAQPRLGGEELAQLPSIWPGTMG